MEAIELNRSGDIDNNLLNNEPKFKEEKQIKPLFKYNYELILINKMKMEIIQLN